MPTHFAVNPQTGERLALLGDKWVPATSLQTGTPGGGPKLTEDQGKSQTYAKLMADAERSYDRAVQQGYKPGSLRNTVASTLEGLPFGGLDGAGAFVRDPTSDRARQAELQWSDAQLKAVSGAASPEAEVKRNVRTYFARPGEDMQDIEPQKHNARLTAFEGAKTRAGPAAGGVPPYPQDLPHPVRGTYTRMFTTGRIDQHAPFGSATNPFVLRDPAQINSQPKGSYVITPDGHFGVID